ncbi:hypothetical protein JHK84_044926 [Glycine max]|nr:hypothetical protein JHK85_045432 [Glycine max]KAG5108019.1 hypothetical protein JHK84_044926 [Glycine max]
MLWSLDNIVVDLASHQGVVKGYKKAVQQSSSKSQVLLPFVMISVAGILDDVPVHANIKGGIVNSWRRDNQAYNEEGVRPGIEKWQGNSSLIQMSIFLLNHMMLGMVLLVAKQKASKMKELVFKKRSKLEEICKLTHIEPDTSIVAEKASALIHYDWYNFCPVRSHWIYKSLILNDVTVASGGVGNLTTLNELESHLLVVNEGWNLGGHDDLISKTLSSFSKDKVQDLLNQALLKQKEETQALINQSIAQQMKETRKELQAYVEQKRLENKQYKKSIQSAIATQFTGLS